MSIDSIINVDFPRREANDNVLKSWEVKRAQILSRPLKQKSFFDKVEFYARKEIIKLKYDLLMFGLEEKLPVTYKALISIGLPKPYIREN